MEEPKLFHALHSVLDEIELPLVDKITQFGDFVGSKLIVVGFLISSLFSRHLLVDHPSLLKHDLTSLQESFALEREGPGRHDCGFCINFGFFV